MPKCSYLKLFLVNHCPNIWRCCGLSSKWAYTHFFLEIQSSFALDIVQAKKSTGTLLQQPVMSKLQGYNYLFLLSKQKAAYSWAQLFEKEKKKPTTALFKNYSYYFHEMSDNDYSGKSVCWVRCCHFQVDSFQTGNVLQGTSQRSDSTLWQSWKYNSNFLSDLLQWERVSVICLHLWLVHSFSVYLFWSLKYLSTLQIIEKMKHVLWDVLFLRTLLNSEVLAVTVSRVPCWWQWILSQGFSDSDFNIYMLHTFSWNGMHQLPQGFSCFKVPRRNWGGCCTAKLCSVVGEPRMMQNLQWGSKDGGSY